MYQKSSAWVVCRGGNPDPGSGTTEDPAALSGTRKACRVFPKQDPRPGPGSGSSRTRPKTRPGFRVFPKQDPRPGPGAGA